MTIRRQYTLPNCNLILEGMSGEDAFNPQAPMTVLLSTECQFPGISDPLVGGRDFLEALVAAVSGYAQYLLSGVPTKTKSGEGSTLGVSLTPTADHRHQLRVTSPEKAVDQAAMTVTLTTVQLFDLMEAIDQLLADGQTLPNLNLKLVSVPRRDTQPQEPLVRRAAPLAVGTSSLVAAAAVLFFVPNPEVDVARLQRGPEGSTPTDASAAPDASPESPSADGTDGTSNPNPVAAPEAAASLARLAAAPAITDADTLAQLQTQLVADLQAAVGDSTFETDLIYQVAVSATGEILGYRAENDPALLTVDATPLPTLTYLPVDPDAAVEEPVAQFRVTLAADGTVSAEPIAATTGTDAESAETAAGTAPETTPETTTVTAADSATAVDSPPLSTAIADEVEDGDRLRAMNRDLYATLRDRRDRRALEEDLIYRVRWTETGELVGFEPDNTAAADQVTITPLPDLLATNPGDDDTPQADFRVVFKVDGVLEVSPWKGFPR